MKRGNYFLEYGEMKRVERMETVLIKIIRGINRRECLKRLGFKTRQYSSIILVVGKFCDLQARVQR